MIRPLRQSHRVIVAALAIVVPVSFVWGIAARSERAGLLDQGVGPRGEARAHGEVWSRDDLWGPKAIRTRLLNDDAHAGGLMIELESKAPIVRPDVLVYWVPGETGIQSSLPESACLLGSFDRLSTVRLPLSAEAAKQTGALVLYSLADQEIVAVSKTASLK